MNIYSLMNTFALSLGAVMSSMTNDSFDDGLGDRQIRIYPLTLPSPPLIPLRGAVERGPTNLPIASIILRSDLPSQATDS